MTYDHYYQTENLFGEPYPELIDFFAAFPKRGTLLDLGCGQGRNAIALARLGYAVTGIDTSKVGVVQMMDISLKEVLNLVGQVEDIYNFDDYGAYDYVLLDSMFHFNKKDRKREVGLIRKIVTNMKSGCVVVICIQDTGEKVQILKQSLDSERDLFRIADKNFKYLFEDRASGHRSESDYRMIAVRKG